MALPAAVQYGQVTWTAIAGGADGADSDGLPDAIPVGGTVTFTPVAPLLLSMADPAVSVFPLPCAYSLDNTGVLRDSQGRAQISLVATDSPGVVPTGWKWSAKFNITAGGQVLNRSIIFFDLPAGTVVDLTKVTPVASSAGVAVTQGPPGPPGPPGPIGPGGSSGMVDSQGLTVVTPRDGNGFSIFAYQYPTWGYGGSAVDENPASPTLLDLNDLGTTRLLWFPGIVGNLVSTPDSTLFAGNTGGVPQVLTVTLDMVTNEFDPIQGLSTYYTLSKPGCWAVRFQETGVIDIRAFDSRGNITLTSTDTFPTKTHITLQIIFTPNNGGQCYADFNISYDGGQSYQPLGDRVIASRTLGPYLTTSGSSLGVIYGGNTNANQWRGGLLSARVDFGGVLACNLNPSTWAAGATSGTDTVGNVWAIQNPVPTNLVNQTCLAVGGGEYVTLTGSPAGQQFTTAGLYPTLTLSGFRWDASNSSALAVYRDSNKLLNLAATPTVDTATFFIDPTTGHIACQHGDTIIDLGA